MNLNLLADRSVWGDVPTWVGVAGGLIAFSVGLWQYARAQSWQRLQFVASQMANFFADPEVRTALLLLDYSRIRLNTDGTRATTPGTGSVFDDDLCTRALRLHTEFADQEENFGPDEMMVRSVFDALLTRLEDLDHFLVSELVSADDLEPYLKYWLRIMLDPASEWKPRVFYEAVSKFITGYGYRGVQHLAESVAGIKLTQVAKARPGRTA